jgi:hypothetical protein
MKRRFGGRAQWSLFFEPEKKNQISKFQKNSKKKPGCRQLHAL